jgi:hypothetical protein
MGRCLFEADDQIDALCINKFGQKQVFIKWRVRTRWLGEQIYGGCLFEAGVDAVKPNNTITPVHFNTLICIWY